MSGSACEICGRSAPQPAEVLGVCADCVRHRFDTARLYVERAHAQSREAFGLPARAPRSEGGVRCNLCVNECVIGEGERGFCGLRTVRGGKLVHLAGTPGRGLLSWYRDPIPTNCVADWVCEGSRRPGCHNLAVFYNSCTSNCLFCQNWHFRGVSPSRGETVSAQALAGVANDRTFCVCYFGGDPASQMPHALAASKRYAERGVRVCWETAGMMHPKLLDAAVGYSLRTGGCIKFDLKAYDENLHRALTGASNRRTLENFRRAARRGADRRQPPLVIASTLLVPGYVGADEVAKIARFIAALDPQIPYSLLAFAPNFCMGDLPCTPVRQAREAEAAALAAGLMNVRVGNRELLGRGWG
ncbi:MAG: radical SAM protein [Gemmatimonadota bacterium]|nr:MAG: radical SAM protein [Gemmatimonadota bacterium]